MRYHERRLHQNTSEGMRSVFGETHFIISRSKSVRILSEFQFSLKNVMNTPEHFNNTPRPKQNIFTRRDGIPYQNDCSKWSIIILSSSHSNSLGTADEKYSVWCIVSCD
ncbi:hypothetical protein RF11_11846 [Thelohanellus kitauei]|uniref:Uncharacterized protein n=1 Tax=Thelohanellus kitauei TaxID=669202 RepID=A0A0C2NMG8_THEKT|nr:hypothetical protein RF11_11846 [Thelohanellus kitauei]